MAEKQTGSGTGRWLILIGLLTTLLIGGCGNVRNAPAARAAFEEANQLFRQGRYPAALQRYARIAEEHPAARDRVLFEMGIVQAHADNPQKDYRQAGESFRRLVAEYPDSPYRQNSQAMLFHLDNIPRKDATIATQQARIDALRQEVEGRENEVADLKDRIAALERKHFALVLEKGAADRILIEKAERRMTLFAKGEVLKTYSIALGGDPIGPKERQGDNKTPEGTYVVESRNRDSRYHLALRISYPNERDKERARQLGVAPGGDIMIHGLESDFAWVGGGHSDVDWTNGCIAVSDSEIEEIAKLAPDGTVVEIRP